MNENEYVCNSEKKRKDGGVRQKAMTQKMREVGEDYTASNLVPLK